MGCGTFTGACSIFRTAARRYGCGRGDLCQLLAAISAVVSIRGDDPTRDCVRLCLVQPLPTLLEPDLPRTGVEPASVIRSFLTPRLIVVGR